MNVWRYFGNASFSFCRLQKKIQNIDPLYWLKSVPFYPKFYWEDREKQECIAGVGSLREFEEANYFSPDVLLFSMQPFDTQKKGFPWEGFPLKKQYILPRFEVHKNENLCMAVQNANAPENTPFPFYADTPKLTTVYLDTELKSVFPNHEEWSFAVQKALKAIKKNELEKVVLARMKEYLLHKVFSVYDYINSLRNVRKNTFVFFYAPNEEEAFFSFSPERLYLRKDRMLLSEALAGTNYKKKKNLLKDPKENQEFSLVKSSIENVFSKLCSSPIHSSKTTLLETQNLQHLYSRIEGILPSLYEDEKLLQELHPTPAMAGLPKDKALSLLLELEPFTRGYYAAPLGWIRANSAEFITGIRSGLLRKNSLYLFSGTGLVKDSTAPSEWEELEQKLSFYQETFQGI